MVVLTAGSPTYFPSQICVQYIFDVSLEQGFTLEGNITHQDVAGEFDFGLEVRRITYIENVLYTISERRIMMNNLNDLAVEKEISLP